MGILYHCDVHWGRCARPIDLFVSHGYGSAITPFGADGEALESEQQRNHYEIVNMREENQNGDPSYPIRLFFKCRDSAGTGRTGREPYFI